MSQRFLRRGHICVNPRGVMQRQYCATSAQAPKNKGGQCVRAPDCSSKVTIRGWNLAVSIYNRNKYTCRGVYTKIRRYDCPPRSANIWKEQGLFPRSPASVSFPRVSLPATFSRTRCARYFCVFPVCKDSRLTMILSSQTRSR